MVETALLWHRAAAAAYFLGEASRAGCGLWRQRKWRRVGIAFEKATGGGLSSSFSAFALAACVMCCWQRQAGLAAGGVFSGRRRQKRQRINGAWWRQWRQWWRGEMATRRALAKMMNDSEERK
jgi:hypothetical protein